MNLLLDNFEMLANSAFNAAKLKELILQLAVQGKLVEQDPNDEPASICFKKIKLFRNKKGQEFLSDKIKVVKNILPNGWEWVVFCDVIDLKHGHQFRQNDFVPKGLPVIKIGQCKSDGSLDLKNCDYIDKTREKEFKDFIIEKDDVLMALTGGTLGKVTRVDNDYGVVVQNYRVGKFIPCPYFNKSFLIIILKSNLFQGLVSEQVNQNAQPNIGKEKIEKLLIPLPPLPEQHRIVSRVESLFVKVDELAKLINASEKNTNELGKSILNELVHANTAEEIKQSWQTTADNFTTLFSTQVNVKELRKTCLQLAVQGKLTHQNPADEPASKLLEKIKRIKEKLIKEKKLKKGKSAGQSISFIDEYKTQNNWTWCKTDDIFFVTKLAGFEYTDHLTLCLSGDIPVVRAQNVRPLEIDKTNLLYIDKETSLLLDRCSLTKKCLLVTFIGAGIGDVATFSENKRWHLAPNVAKMEPFEGSEDLINLKYINYFLLSKIGQREIFKHVKTTAQPSLSMGTIRDIDISFPPIAEQHRIFAQVEKLMSLCDTLEEQIIRQKELQQKLMMAVVRDAVG